MLADWRLVRRFCRDAAEELTRRFKLPDVIAVAPLGFKQQWLKETGALTEGVAEGDARRGPGRDHHAQQSPAGERET